MVLLPLCLEGQEANSVPPQVIRFKHTKRAPLVVVGFASPEEREIAEQLISQRQHLPTLEAQARRYGFQVVSRKGTVYLLPPRLHNEIPPHLVTELTILLQQSPPRSPQPIAKLPPRLQSLIHQWLVSERYLSHPSKVGEVASLLSKGYYWWSGMLEYQIELGERTFSGGHFLEMSIADALPREPSPSDAADPAPPKAQLPKQNAPSLEETLLFSEALPLSERVAHAKAFWEIVEEVYKQGYEEYKKVLGSLQNILAQHYRLPSADEWKGVSLNQLPEEIQAKIVEAVQRSFLPDLSLSEVRDQLRGASIKIELVPIVMVGGFVDNDFHGYGWGVSELLKL